MTFPGINVLGIAHQLIGYQKAQHWKFKVMELGDGGVPLPIYFPTPVDIAASIQPVPRNMYETLGLDLQKSYITVYSPAPLGIRDLERGRGPDMLDWNCGRYTVESNTPWQNQDGWFAAICIHTGPVPV